MINPDLVNTIRVGELPSEPFNLTDNIPHEIGTDLKRGTVQQLADFIATVIDVSGGVGFRAVSVVDGQTLPETTTQEFILVGKGTYFNVGGGDTIVLTEELNALVSNGSFWFVGVEIPIDVELAGITQEIREGFLTTAPSENAVFNAITNLDIQDVIEVPTFALLPPVGVAEKIYITLDTNILYRFNGVNYIALSADVSGKEDVANKSSSFTASSTTTYANTKALVDGLATKQNTISGTTNVVPKFGTGGLVNTTISEDANGVLISGAYAVNSVAPLIIRNTAGNTANNISQIWQNSTGTAVASLRNDGFFGTTGTVNSGAFVTTLAGTATTNAIRLSGQNGTGLFFPPSNILAFSTNAVERLRIHSSGRFSFGSIADDGINIAQFNGTVKASPATTSDQLATLGQVNTVDANNVKLTGFQEITGLKSFRPASGATGIQVIATAGTNGVGVFSDSQNTGYTSFRASTNGTGFNFEGQNNGTTTFSVDKLGVVTGTEGTANNTFTTLGKLKSRDGWASYSTTTYTNASPFVVAPNTTVTLPNNANNSITTDLPLGVTAFYNGTTNKITPSAVGDAYTVNVRFKARTTMNNDYLTLFIDIGAGTQINAEAKQFLKGANTEQPFSFTMPIFTLATFVANGGEIKVASNGGTISIYDVTFYINRNYTR